MNDDYELKILASVICRYLNEREPVKEADLNIIEANLDDTVWEFAVRFYNESGHKAEFIKVRSVVNSWINLKKEKLTQKKIMNASLRKPKIAPELPVSKINLSDKVNHTENQQTKALQDKSKEIPKDFDENKERTRIFEKFAGLISKELEVTQDLVTLDTDLSTFPKVEDRDLFEILLLVEEEFNIEISDAENESRLGIFPPDYSPNYEFIGSSWGKKRKKIVNKPLPPKLQAHHVMVKQFVDLIYEKLYV